MAYPIVEGGCLDSFVEVRSNVQNLVSTDFIGISYMAFQFIDSESDISTLKISCTVCSSEIKPFANLSTLKPWLKNLNRYRFENHMKLLNPENIFNLVKHGKYDPKNCTRKIY